MVGDFSGFWPSLDDLTSDLLVYTCEGHVWRSHWNTVLYFFWSEWDLEAWWCFVAPSWCKPASYISPRMKTDIVCGFILLLFSLLILTTFPTLPMPRPWIRSVCVLKSMCFHLYRIPAGRVSSCSPSGAGVVLSATPVSFCSSHSFTINSSMQRDSPASRSTPTSSQKTDRRERWEGKGGGVGTKLGRGSETKRDTCKQREWGGALGMEVGEK